MKEGLSLGCGAVGKWISDLCLDAEPLCLAALKLACGICNNHCDYNVVAQVGSHDVAFAVCALCGGAVFGPWHSSCESYLGSGTLCTCLNVPCVCVSSRLHVVCASVLTGRVQEDPRVLGTGVKDGDSADCLLPLQTHFVFFQFAR